MHFVIITGMSGAGKSTAIKALEDLGYFCIDNLPPSLLPKIAEFCAHSEGKINKIAIVIDSRVGELLKDIFTQLSYLKDLGYRYEILFLETSDQVLIKRYKENRRTHPLSREGRITSGIKEERKLISEVKNRSNHIIDTSLLTPKQLREHLISIFSDDNKGERMIISIISFGFKHGMPIDVDLVFDVRFIPNPFYINTMKKLSGKDKMVRDYVLGHNETQTFLQKTEDMLEFLIPNYIKEGKNQLVIGIGCTGGQHRSVTIAEELRELLINNGHKVAIEHRDVDNNNRSV